MPVPDENITLNRLAQQVIKLQQHYIAQLGYTAHIHFELEGCFQTSIADLNPIFSAINAQLKKYSIAGELVNEYWHNQWEYVSKFQGQSPLTEAHNLFFILHKLPQIAASYGIENTLIEPVVFNGDTGKLAQNCAYIFSHDKRDVHIPNAIQLNISVSDNNGANLVAQPYFGELLQQCFMRTSLPCCLLYLPEEAAFERFALKTKYGLANELCSPIDISGGYQGSIALYRQQGKHDQLLGEQVLLYDQHQQALLSEYHWQSTARVEHRLGAASRLYNPYVNVVFALANLIDALNLYIAQQDNPKQLQRMSENSVNSHNLPKALYGEYGQLGAVELFAQDQWLVAAINKVQQQCMANKLSSAEVLTSEFSYLLGEPLKKHILMAYQINELS